MTDIQPTIATIIDRWLAYRQKLMVLDAVRQSTVVNQSAIAGTFRTAFGHTPAGELRKSELELWARGRLQTHAAVTVVNELNVFKAVLNWAVDERLLAERPKFPTIHNPTVEKPLPDDAAYVWYLTNLRQHHADAMQFMMLTGLAPHELARLRSTDYDDQAREICIGGRADFFVKTAARHRAIPLNVMAQIIWLRCAVGKAADVPVFEKENTIQKAMRRLFLSRPDAPANADGLTPKMMRKWFASKIANEYSEAALQRLLGHAPGSKITRQHYIRTQAELLRDAVGGLAI